MTFAPLVITINETVIGDETFQVASMNSGPSVPNKSILYGLQSPVLEMKPMELVLDLDYRAYGPAYHFSARYDKLVILPPEELNLGSGLKKRDDQKYRQHFQVKPGDYPWFCYWNGTYVEGYIYSEDNSTAASFTSFPTQWPTPTSSESGTSSTAAVTVAAAMATTSSSSLSASTQPAAVAATPSSVPMNGVIPHAGRDTSSDASSPPRMPPYPRIVKVEERRLPNSPQPYCQQMLLLDNGQITPAPAPNDSPIRIWLQESDPSYQEYFAAQSTEAPTSDKKGKRQSPSGMQRRSDPPDACHCQWMFK